MKHWIFGCSVLISFQTAALACSCIPDNNPSELKRFTAVLAEDAVALVEAEALTSFERTRRGERMRVIRTLAGSAPHEFRIERSHVPGSGSCDVLYKVGERTVIVLYPPASAKRRQAIYRTSGLCAVPLLQQPDFRDGLIRAMTKRGERG